VRVDRVNKTSKILETSIHVENFRYYHSTLTTPNTPSHCVYDMSRDLSVHSTSLSSM
jgi:hypothetical protein